MLRWIIGTSLRARRLVVALAAGMLILGITQFRSMPVDVLPEFTPTTVEIQTDALGLSAEEVEQLITVPLEQDLLNGIAFLDEIRSASLPGLSSIQMIFEPGTDLLDARQVVQERLSQAQVALPGVSSKPPQMLQPRSSASRVMMVSLSSDELSTIDMSILGRWTIGPKLLGVPGVANVAIWGFRDKQLQVLVDPERLSANGVSLSQIIETTANAQFVCPLTFVECSTPGTGGLIETSNQRIGVQHVPVTATPEDLARVPVEGVQDGRLLLGDVADVVEDHQPLIGDAVGPDLLLVIEKFPDANTLEVTRGVEEALDELAPGLSGIRIDTALYRPATYIETAGDNLLTAILIGAALALLALVLLLFEWRRILVGVVTMLVSLATAAFVLSLTEATLNSMVLAGLVLALVAVVDDAVCDVENLARRLREGREAADPVSAPRIVLEAALEMRGAAAYATFIAVVCVVPVFFTQGAFGAFAPSLVWSYAVAVVASMVVAVILTPALGLLLLRGVTSKSRATSPIGRLRSRYEGRLARTARSPRPAAIVAGVFLLAGALAVPFLTRSTTPSFTDTNLLVRLSGASGMSLPEMQRVSGRMADELRRVPGVREVGAHVGRALLSDQRVGSNAGELWVTLDPGADHDDTAAAVEDVVQAYPGLEREVTTYPRERIAEVLSGPEAPVVVRVFGLDLELLRQKGEEVRRVLSGIEGVVDPRVELGTLEPGLQIEVDLDRAAQHAIVPGDVRRAATTLLSGITVGSLFEEQKVFEVVVWGTPETRADLPAIDQLLIDTREGDQVRLGDVADVRIVASPTVIRHEDVQRYVDVLADVSGRDLGAVLDEVDDGLAQVDFPLEYHAEVLTDSQDLRAADQRAMVAVVVATIVVFLLLHAALGNRRVAALAFVILALSLVGGAIAVLIAGGTVSFGSIVGFFAVLGIAAKQVVVLIRHYRHMEREGGSFGPELVIGGTRDRFAPIVTAAFTALVLFVPLALAGGMAGLEIVQPMAVVVTGGLIASTLLNLFVVPGLYLRFGSTDLETAEVSMERLMERRDNEEMGAIGGRS